MDSSKAHTILHTSFGTLRATWSRRGLCKLDWLNSNPVGPMGLRSLPAKNEFQSESSDSLFTEQTLLLKEELDGYMAGQIQHFSVPLAISDSGIGTEFQSSVWRALIEIKYGSITTYSEVSRHIGRPKAMRAVANAIGANPVPILIPCHRVLRSDGALGGYSFAEGPELKARLLEIETSRIHHADRMKGKQFPANLGHMQ